MSLRDAMHIITTITTNQTFVNLFSTKTQNPLSNFDIEGFTITDVVSKSNCMQCMPIRHSLR